MAKERLSSERLRKITFESPVSGNKWQDLVGVYRLPQNLKEVMILDVCAGESNFCDWLLKQGSRAFAVDYLYSNLDQLHIKRLENLLKVEGLAGKVSPTDPRLRGKFDPDTALFRESIRNNPSSYMSASTSALPFRDGIFRYVTSYYGIFGVMDRDMQLLEASTNEALRVLKHGGELQIAPALVGGGLTEQEIGNQKTLLDRLQKDESFKLSYSRCQSQEMSVGRVIITKI